MIAHLFDGTGVSLPPSRSHCRGSGRPISWSVSWCSTIALVTSVT